MANVAIDQLVGIFGTDIRTHLQASATTAWDSDPLVRGAYSALRPGHKNAVLDLGQSLANALFFAGEATSPTLGSTLQGRASVGHRRGGCGGGSHPPDLAFRSAAQRLNPKRRKWSMSG